MKTHETFLGKIFGTVWDKLKAAFTRADHKLLDIAITVTNAVKDVLKSPVVDIITAIIPTNIDNKIVEILRAKLPILLADELLLRTLRSDATEAEVKEISVQIAQSFGNLSDEKKQQFYTSMAAKVYIFLNEHKNGEVITFGQSAYFVETAWQAWKNFKDGN